MIKRSETKKDKVCKCGVIWVVWKLLPQLLVSNNVRNLLVVLLPAEHEEAALSVVLHGCPLPPRDFPTRSLACVLPTLYLADKRLGVQVDGRTLGDFAEGDEIGRGFGRVQVQRSFWKQLRKRERGGNRTITKPNATSSSVKATCVLGRSEERNNIITKKWEDKSADC